jgi:hypothetical protein
MLKYDGQKYKISARFAPCEQKYDALKFDEWHYFDAPVFPCGHFFGPVGDDEQIFAVELIGRFNEGVEFALASFFRRHIVADLD